MQSYYQNFITKHLSPIFMTLLKLTKRTVGLCLVQAILLGCGKEEYPAVSLFTWKAKVDVTDKAKISVNFENSGGATAGEGSLKLVDNDVNSKFLINPYQSTFYMQLTFPAAQQVASYTLTSGNDAPGRDPKDWVLSGSMDGSTWVELDKRAGETFSGRNLTKTYSFKNTTLYNQYRISVSAIGSGTLFQLSEWRVIEVPAEQQ
jgi:hypothetical protein